MRLAGQFLSDESGAVTVDWVVLTAGVVAMAFFFIAPIVASVGNLSVSIADSIGEAEEFVD
jgi:hypothetical protein